MARYINTDKINISDTVGGQNEFADCIRDAVKEVLNNAETEDVVERSKYDNLHNLAKSWLEEKKELEKANDELRSKIDKAITEIEKTTNTYQGFLMHEGTKETILKILKEI